MLIILIVMTLKLSGLLQLFELKFLDYYFRLRPTEPLDPRIVIVGITQQDISTLRDYPLTDEILAQLLEKIKQQQPRAIGLDIYRDLPVPAQKGEGYQKLVKVFQTTPNLVVIEKVMGKGNNPPVAPPPALLNSDEWGLVAANDIIEDRDLVIRRAVLLTPKTEERDRVPTLGLVLADLYLQKEKGINVKWLPNLTLQYDSVKLTRFDQTDGGYVDANDTGYQILLNYRTPPGNFKTVSVMDVLEGKISPDLMGDRIVLIGNTSPDWKDFFNTPFGANFQNSDNSDNKFYGVFLQANIISSILSAVLDERPLIKTWSELLELLWTSLWIFISLIIIWRFGHKNQIEVGNWHKHYFFYVGSFLICVFIAGSVCVITLLAFIREAYWLSVTPPLIGIFGSFVLGARAVYVSKLKESNTELRAAKQKLAESNETLEQKVAERTQELEDTVKQLKETETKLLFQYEQLKEINTEDLYFLGGTMPPDWPTYVNRHADIYLYKGIMKGQFCYVFNARQMGKSSLCIKTIHELKKKGVTSCSVDLGTFTDKNIDEEKWYGAICYKILVGFKLNKKIPEFKAWWREIDYLPARLKLSEFIKQYIVEEISSPLCIFIDELDSISKLKFNPDGFFATIRNFYNERSSDSELRRLTFVLLGAANSFNLFRDEDSTPYNIGLEVKLEPFKLHDCEPLTKGFINKHNNPRLLLKEILEWTGGQPFLTQKVCQLVGHCEIPIERGKESEWVANLIQAKIIDNWLNKEDSLEHFKNIRNRLISQQSSSRKLLNLYQNLLESKEIEMSPSSIQQELILTGLVYQEGGKLRIYNQIYQKIFNKQWVSKALDSLIDR